MTSRSIARRDSGRWRARYRDAAGKEHARHFDRKIDAQHWLDEVTSAVVTGTYIDPKRSRSTVGAMAQTWLRSNPDWTASTRARNESILARHVLPRWGSARLDAVEFEAVQEWVTGMSDAGLAGGTVRKVHGVLSSVLRLAVRSRRLAAYPGEGVRLPKQGKPGKRYLTAGQVERLAGVAGEHQDVVFVLAYCGLRMGELSALRKRNVDMLRRRLSVEASVTEVNGRLEWGAPKDDESRSVPFPAFLADMLASRLEGKADEDMLFESPEGGVLRVRNMRRGWFDAAAVEAGIPGLTPHELRHTAASIAVSAGASVLALQRMLGHARPSMTLDTYSDLFDEDLDAVADRLESARSRILADSLRTAGVSRVSDSEAAGL